MEMTEEERKIAEDAVLFHRTNLAIYSAQADYTQYLLDAAAAFYRHVRHLRESQRVRIDDYSYNKFNCDDFIGLGITPFTFGAANTPVDAGVTYKAISALIEEAHGESVRAVNSRVWDVEGKNIL